MMMKTMMFDVLVQILCHCVVNSAGTVVSMMDFQSDDWRVIKVASISMETSILSQTGPSLFLSHVIRP